MGELYNPYPKLPKNIRQIGERDTSVKLYIEDYVNTYLKRLYPTGGQDLRVGLLLGETRAEDGMPYLFADGALEMEGVTADGAKVEFTEEAWKRAYHQMEQMFPRRNILGWFLCGAPGCALSPLDYWKQHSQYFSGKNQLMYLNCGLEGEEVIYEASEDGFYKLRGYSIYYEKNQMMQDYMVSRKDAHRVETMSRDAVTQDFRQKLESRKEEAVHRRSVVSTLGTACGVLSVMVLAGGVVMFSNYHKMKEMETVIASALPERAAASGWLASLKGGSEESSVDEADSGEVVIEQIPGDIYPTLAQGDEAAAGAAGGTGAAEAAGAASMGATGAEGASGAASMGAAGAEGAAGVADAAGAGSAAGGAASPEVLPETAGSNNPSAAGSNNSSAAGSAAEPSVEPAAVTVQIPSNAVPYVIQSGETLYGICMEKYQSMSNIETICQWNGLGDGSHLSVGQEIWLPPISGQ